MALALLSVIGPETSNAIVGAVLALLLWTVLRRQFAAPRARLLVAVMLVSVTLLAVLLSSNGWFTVTAAAGAVVGIAQWLVLRRWLPQSSWWVPANAFGNAVGWSIGQNLNMAVGRAAPVSETFGAVVIGMLAGAASGFVEWLMFRGRLPQVRWWVPAAATAATVGLIIQFGLVNDVPRPLLESTGLLLPFVLTGLGGAMSGLVMGTAVFVLLRARDTSRREVQSTARPPRDRGGTMRWRTAALSGGALCACLGLLLVFSLRDGSSNRAPVSPGLPVSTPATSVPVQPSPPQVPDHSVALGSADSAQGPCPDSQRRLVPAKGVVKWFNDAKGYGFIEVKGCGDVFVHYTAIQAEGFKSLATGDEVDVEVVMGPKGLEAKNVRKVTAP